MAIENLQNHFIFKKNLIFNSSFWKKKISNRKKKKKKYIFTHFYRGVENMGAG
jgi:hypothetical protein